MAYFILRLVCGKDVTVQDRVQGALQQQLNALWGSTHCRVNPQVSCHTLLQVLSVSNLPRTSTHSSHRCCVFQFPSYINFQYKVKKSCKRITQILIDHFTSWKKPNTVWNGDFLIFFFLNFDPLSQWLLLEWGKQLVLGGQDFMLICHTRCKACKRCSRGLLQKLLIPIMSLSKIWSKLTDCPLWKPMGNSYQKNGCWYSNAPFKTELRANRLMASVLDLRQVYYFKLLLRIAPHFSW